MNKQFWITALSLTELGHHGLGLPSSFRHSSSHTSTARIYNCWVPPCLASSQAGSTGVQRVSFQAWLSILWTIQQLLVWKWSLAMKTPARRSACYSSSSSCLCCFWPKMVFRPTSIQKISNEASFYPQAPVPTTTTIWASRSLPSPLTR